MNVKKMYEHLRSRQKKPTQKQYPTRAFQKSNQGFSKPILWRSPNLLSERGVDGGTSESSDCEVGCPSAERLSRPVTWNREPASTHGSHTHNISCRLASVTLHSLTISFHVLVGAARARAVWEWSVEASLIASFGAAHLIRHP